MQEFSISDRAVTTYVLVSVRFEVFVLRDELDPLLGDLRDPSAPHLHKPLGHYAGVQRWEVLPVPLAPYLVEDSEVRRLFLFNFRNNPKFALSLHRLFKGNEIWLSPVDYLALYGRDLCTKIRWYIRRQS